MEDALGRKWQMGTIQLDSQMPSRFGLKYVALTTPSTSSTSCTERCTGRSSASSDPHRAFAGEFPCGWRPCRCGYAGAGRHRRLPARRRKLEQAGVRAEVDERDETVGKRIREAELEKIPYVIVFGDRESEESLAVRARGGEQATQGLEEFLASLPPQP